MSFEIRQGGVPRSRRECASALEKQSHVSHETRDFETHQTAGFDMVLGNRCYTVRYLVANVNLRTPLSGPLLFSLYLLYQRESAQFVRNFMSITNSCLVQPTEETFL
jgi:hypothetical protein